MANNNYITPGVPTVQVNNINYPIQAAASASYNPLQQFSGQSGMVFKYKKPPRPKKSILPPSVMLVSAGGGTVATTSGTVVPASTALSNTAMTPAPPTPIVYSHYHHSTLPKPPRPLHCDWYFFRVMTAETYALMPKDKDTFFIEDGSKFEEELKKRFPSPEGCDRVTSNAPAAWSLQLDAVASLAVTDRPILRKGMLKTAEQVAKNHGAVYIPEDKIYRTNNRTRKFIQAARWEPIVYGQGYIMSYVQKLGFYSLTYSPKRMANLLRVRREHAASFLAAKSIPGQLLKRLLGVLLAYIDVGCTHLRSLYNVDRRRLMHKGKFHMCWSVTAALKYINQVPILRRRIHTRAVFLKIAAEALPYLAGMQESEQEREREAAHEVLKVLKRAGRLPQWLKSAV